jgi:RIO kinase 1
MSFDLAGFAADEPTLVPPLDGIDPRFVFAFQEYADLGDDQRWSTWLDVEPLCRGPEPRPDWVVTDRAAVDTELGILKTGKEADVFLVERALEDGPSVVMAAKRYRPPQYCVHRGLEHAPLA